MKIILVDDHQLMLDGLSQILCSLDKVEILATYTNPTEALAHIPILKPDLVFTDLDMPQLHGLELAKALKKALSNIKIIVLSMHLDPMLVKKLMKIDVDGYLLKTDDKADFIHAIKQVEADKKVFSTSVTEALAGKKSILNNTSSSFTKKTLELSDREKEILIKIAEGFNSRDIAEKLFISTGTVESHRKNIMKKLEVSNMAGLVRIAVKEGLV